MSKISLCFALSIMSVTGSALASTDPAATYSRSQIEAATAAIMTREQLDVHLATDQSSPIYKMSPSSRTGFVASLVFTKRGLGSYSFVDLAGLTVADAYRVLSLFGSQSAIGSIPDLRDESELDHSILEQSRKDAKDKVGVAPTAIDRFHTVCHVHPDSPSECVGYSGSHCNESCG